MAYKIRPCSVAFETRDITRGAIPTVYWEVYEEGFTGIGGMSAGWNKPERVIARNVTKSQAGDILKEINEG